MAGEQTTSFQRLSADKQQLLKVVVDATVECLQEYAQMMDAGEIEMMSGPKALRVVAALLNRELINQEGSTDV